LKDDTVKTRRSPYSIASTFTPGCYALRSGSSSKAPTSAPTVRELFAFRSSCVRKPAIRSPRVAGGSFPTRGGTRARLQEDLGRG
jgi:hypothetical protein